MKPSSFVRAKPVDFQKNDTIPNRGSGVGIVTALVGLLLRSSLSY